jgi:hypothetical protein
VFNELPSLGIWIGKGGESNGRVRDKNG